MEDGFVNYSNDQTPSNNFTTNGYEQPTSGRNSYVNSRSVITPTSYLHLQTNTAQTPQEIHKDLVLSYTKALNYSLTPRGSDAELNYINPQNVELLRYNRLSQSYKQINNVDQMPSNGGYYYNSNVGEHGQTTLISSPDSNNKKHVPSTYWMLACVSFLCCFPVGSIALYKSYQTGKAIQNKDNVYAENLSVVTRFFCVLAILFGMLFISVGSALRLHAMYDERGNFL